MKRCGLQFANTVTNTLKTILNIKTNTNIGGKSMSKISATKQKITLIIGILGCILFIIGDFCMPPSARNRAAKQSEL